MYSQIMYKLQSGNASPPRHRFYILLRYPCPFFRFHCLSTSQHPTSPNHKSVSKGESCESCRGSADHAGPQRSSVWAPPSADPPWRRSSGWWPSRWPSQWFPRQRLINPKGQGQSDRTAPQNLTKGQSVRSVWTGLDELEKDQSTPWNPPFCATAMSFDHDLHGQPMSTKMGV